MKELSIIIPSYNDEKNVKSLVKQIFKKKLSNSEIVIVESGKVGYRKEILKEVVFLKSGKGRALQMNTGARKAKGKLLVFLHADSDISGIDFSKFYKLTKEDEFGCFRIKFKSKKKYFRFVEITSNLRKKIFGIPFGDQGLIISRKLFNRVGGFSEGGFEDIDMALHLMNVANIKIINQYIKTSPRRFLEHGIVKTHLIMGLIFLSYSLGLKRVAFWFYGMIK